MGEEEDKAEAEVEAEAEEGEPGASFPVMLHFVNCGFEEWRAGRSLVLERSNINVCVMNDFCGPLAFSCAAQTTALSAVVIVSGITVSSHYFTRSQHSAARTQHGRARTLCARPSMHSQEVAQPPSPAFASLWLASSE